jgi:hypothetical protein
MAINCDATTTLPELMSEYAESLLIPVIGELTQTLMHAICFPPKLKDYAHAWIKSIDDYSFDCSASDILAYW